MANSSEVGITVKDIRLVVAGSSVLLSIIGYILLVVSGSSGEAKELLTVIGLPALTFVIGLGSSLKND